MDVTDVEFADPVKKRSLKHKKNAPMNFEAGTYKSLRRAHTG